MQSLTRSRLASVSISTICAILMAFILINPQLFFKADLGAWQEVIFIYVLLYLIAAKNDDPEVSDRPLSDPIRYILVTAVILIGVSMLGITSTVVPPQFTGWVQALIYIFAVIAFVESKVFIQWLPREMGIIPASLLFAVFHVGVYLLLIPVHIGPALAVAAVMNYALYMIYIHRQSLYEVMLIHAAIDMAVWGYLCILL